MKKIVIAIACASLAACVLVLCSGRKVQANEVVPAHGNVPGYTIVNRPQTDLSAFPKDKDGYYVIFNGSDLAGWRGYGKDYVPSKWTVEDGAIKFNGKGSGVSGEGGDLIFGARFTDFILEFEWKVAKGSNSGAFYLAREIATGPEDNLSYKKIYFSAPEYQILDNENHHDALLGVDGNRKSASLYDMIPAKPQNALPYGEWNTARITLDKGHVTHSQNGVDVLEYDMWTDAWTGLLEASKFSSAKNPLAFELLNGCGGPSRSGYIGFQDHGNIVWYRNVRVKVLRKGKVR